MLQLVRTAQYYVVGYLGDGQTTIETRLSKCWYKDSSTDWAGSKLSHTKGIVLIREIGRDLKRSGKHIYRPSAPLALPPLRPEIITRLQNSIYYEHMGLCRSCELVGRSMNNSIEGLSRSFLYKVFGYVFSNMSAQVRCTHHILVSSIHMLRVASSYRYDRSQIIDQL